MTIIAVSDTHLGYKHSNADAFSEFLDRIEERGDLQHFVICGDFLDMWRRDLAGVVLESAGILDKVRSLQPRVEVHYVVGNHDYHAIKLTDHGYPFEFVEELTLREAQIDFKFVHGYQFDPFQNPVYFDALCYTTDDTGDHLNQAWERLMEGRRWWDRLADWILGRKSRFDRQVERMLMPPQVRLQDARETIQRDVYAFPRPNEFLVFGHTHKAFLDMEKNVANTGAWTNDSQPENTYLEIKDGTARLLQYKGTEVSAHAFSL
jgi:UDP-2,3-diacylglucosamine pyrophosphatase LpxH